MRVYDCPYDWRVDLDQAKKDLIDKIDEVRKKTGWPTVDIVAHSMPVPFPHARRSCRPSSTSMGTRIERQSRFLGSLRRRGSVHATFVVPVDYAEAASVIRAPPVDLRRQLERASIEFQELPQEADPRGLVRKAVLLESDGWLAALVGSSIHRQD